MLLIIFLIIQVFYSRANFPRQEKSNYFSYFCEKYITVRKWTNRKDFMHFVNTCSQEPIIISYLFRKDDERIHTQTKNVIRMIYVPLYKIQSHQLFSHEATLYNWLPPSKRYMNQYKTNNIRTTFLKKPANPTQTKTAINPLNIPNKPSFSIH